MSASSRFGGNKSDQTLSTLRKHARPLKGERADYDALISQIGEARFVLLGEATHGTHEFYRERAHITRRLIEEKGFAAVAVEADWPDAYRINEYVRSGDDAVPAIEALSRFKRFPAWMWRNSDVLEFVGWLKEYNATRPETQAVGFYGLDLYSLYTSLNAVIDFLDQVDPQAAMTARARYGCFDMAKREPQSYGIIASADPSLSCEEAVIEQLKELRKKAAEYIRRDGRLASDAMFYAEQNARLAVNAEAYYRQMFRGRVSTWNLRDQHMAETLEELQQFLGRTGQQSKIVVWAHNSHLGDVRATEMGRRGEWNLGQLVRERYGDEVICVGLTTYTGTVTAAENWDAPAGRRHVRPGRRHSYEALFHQVSQSDGDLENFYLNLQADTDVRRLLDIPRLERAIGVIYQPRTERTSHYFMAQLASQFDAVLHFDTTRAVEPLEITPQWRDPDLEETYPFGL